jgi:hypothetical protein
MATAEEPRTEAPFRPLPPAAKLRLAVEILTTYARARRLIGRCELPAAVAALREAPAASRVAARRPLPDGRAHAIRLGKAVVRTLAPLPADSRCLMRSLTLLRMLAVRGAEPRLVIAAQPGAGELEAHAWIEVDERPVLDPGSPDLGRLVTL